MLAKINGVFRLSQDCTLQYTNSGQAVAKLNLVSSEKYGDKETTCFIEATAWGKTGEIINQYAGSKGTQIFLSGKLSQEQWEKDGQKRSKHVMIVEGFEFIGNKERSQQPQQQGGYNQQPQQQGGYNQQNQGQQSFNPQSYEVPEDEVPF